MQQSKIKNGTITDAKKSVNLLVDGQSITGIQITGTFVATIKFEGSLDGSNWVSLFFKDPSTGNDTSSTTSKGIFTGSVAGLKHVRVRASVYTSGTVNVIIVTSFSGTISQNTNESRSSSANTPEIVTDSNNAFGANANRKGWMIQNLGTNPLFVRLGENASTTVFHAVLKGGTGNDDGLGGSIAEFSGVIYTGIITVNGTSPRYTITEL